jgi:hypothetical protein
MRERIAWKKTTNPENNRMDSRKEQERAALHRAI